MRQERTGLGRAALYAATLLVLTAAWARSEPQPGDPAATSTLQASQLKRSAYPDAEGTVTRGAFKDAEGVWR